MTLTIQGETLERIFLAAGNAGHNECMGLMASERGSPTITDMCLLPAEASPTHAEAEPLALRAAVEQIIAKNLVPSGIWHSHGAMRVFHSGTDHATMERLLPAMAAWNFQLSPHAVVSPAVTAPDTALLPLDDGRHMVFNVIGEPLPEGFGHETGRWTSISTKFNCDVGVAPKAVFDGRKLGLEGNGVQVELTIANGHMIQGRLEDRAPHRIATLYSLVVNTRRECFAETLEVFEFGSRCHTRMTPCEVHPVGVPSPKKNNDTFGTFLQALVAGVRESI
jgi:hypothetical protein